MSKDLEERLRREGLRLPDPPTGAMQRVRRAITSDVDERRAWRSARNRPRGLALAAAAFVAAAAFGSGYAVASNAAPRSNVVVTRPTIDGGIGFLPADGWSSINTGFTNSREAPAAVAANLPISEIDLSQGAGNLPRTTISRLRSDGVVLFAIFYPRGEVEKVDRSFKTAALPLRLADAAEGNIEGDPNGGNASYRLTRAVNGWNVDVMVFFGSPKPSATLRAAAEAELERLIVSEAPGP